MKPEAQRIAIAEACGWARTILDPPFLGSTNPCKEIVWCKWEHPTFRPVDNEPGHDPWHGEIVLPDYLNDLNAMREAEKVLMQRLDLWWDYQNNLKKIAKDLMCFGAGSEIHASADQRAEAFLKTIGKWEESS